MPGDISSGIYKGGACKQGNRCLWLLLLFSMVAYTYNYVAPEDYRIGLGGIQQWLAHRGHKCPSEP